MVYADGTVLGDRKVICLSYTLGKINYYTVKCVNCGHQGPMSQGSLSNIKSSGKQCKRCYHKISNQLFGNYKKIRPRKKVS